MSQPEDSPSDILLKFGDNLALRAEGLDEDSLAFQLTAAVITIAYAAADTAHQMEIEDESA